MMVLSCTRLSLLIVVLLCSSTLAAAQGSRDDYGRAGKFLPDEIRHLAYDGQVDARWIGQTDRFWYRKEGPFGKAFVRVDAVCTHLHAGVRP